MVWLAAEQGDGLQAVFTLQSHMHNSEKHRTRGEEVFQLGLAVSFPEKGRETCREGRVEGECASSTQWSSCVQEPRWGTVDIYRLRAARHPVVAGRAEVRDVPYCAGATV